MPLNLSFLNPVQRDAVEQTEGPCMIIAGAGSGKTRVLTYKIAYLLKCGVSPYEILALTFTNKAANEMKERIKHLEPDKVDNLWMGTFHSIFARILRFEAERIGFTRNYTIYDTDDSLNVIRQAMESLNISTQNTSPKSVQSAISSLKNKLVTPEEFAGRHRQYNERKISEVYNHYPKMLLRSNAMDFDDLLIKPIELFERFPEVLEKYSERFKYILVDEYQDTNRAQYIIVKYLSQRHKNISVVGDDAQSIYKWRGAEIQNIFDFETDFPDSKTFRLEQNYRSTKNILALADDVIKKNKRQIEKTLWTDNPEGEKVTLIETMTDKDEASRVSKYIYSEIQKRKLNFKDFAVLYRTNAQSRTTEEALRKDGIPYFIVGGIRFYQRREIKDILSYLKIIVNPSDNEALSRILGLTGGIGRTTIDKLEAIAEENQIQIFDVLKNLAAHKDFSARSRNLLNGVLNFIYKYQNIKDDISLSETIRVIIDEIGILRELKAENTFEAEERIENIKELVSAVAEYADENEDAKLEDFLQQVSLVADIDEVDNEKNAVTLMTIHAAKGLEYSVVFITGLEEGLFPITGAFSTEEEMEEERRLFYVAITRAKEKLYIAFANQRYRYGQQSFQMKSRFIRDITPEISDSVMTKDSFKVSGAAKKSNPYNQEKKHLGSSIKYEFLGNKKKGLRYEFEEDDKFSDIKKGVSVYHNKFGKGQVLNITGRGIEKRADIYFENTGLKKIVLRYAKMRVDA